MKVKIIGIDLAKSVFQVCIMLEDGTIHSNCKINRGKLLHTLRQYPEGTLIAMEACGGSHHWGRTFTNMGFTVRLIPAQHVKPLARKQKNDANDAIAICEAAFRPGIHFVSIKTVEQQDIKALRCVRHRMVQDRTAKANQVRALASEYGVIFPKGIDELRKRLPEVLEDPQNGLSHVMRQLLSGLRDDIKLLDQDISDLETQIGQLCRQQPRYKALSKIPGFGPVLTAAFISDVGTGEQFSNGRQLSAWCGLVPSQHSSGGKSKLGSITKNGNTELRTLLVHGARSVIRFVDRRQDPLGHWLRALVARRGKAKAITALANKMARIGWCISHGKDEFDVTKAFMVK